MYDEMKVKILFLNIKYPLYLKIQIAMVIGWFIGGFLCYLYLKDSSVWYLKNGWWLFPVIAILEVGEAFVVIKKAKKEYRNKNK